MIVAENVTKFFGKFKALDNVSLTCNNGQTISLIGPNGSGKTTFIKSLLGLVIPTSGKITFNDIDIRHDADFRKHIGYMPQIGRYPANMRIAQILDMMCDLRKSDLSMTDNELIEQFELNKIRNKRMRTLSGGTRQKVSAALAFLFKPEVLILDEPTAGLDPLATEILKEKIRTEKNKGRLILITSHILSDLDDLVSEVIYINDGELLFHKSITQLREDTGEEKLSRAIASVMKSQTAELFHSQPTTIGMKI
jgi:Cu-processing system ATP-binding protein